MSCALVCHTAKGDCETLIWPPFSGVVATTSKVGSTMVSARAEVAAALAHLIAERARIAEIAFEHLDATGQPSVVLNRPKTICGRSRR